MTTLFSETWTGTNGAAWNATTWPTIDFTSSSTATIQTNSGEANPGGAGFARVRALSNSGNMADVDLTIQFTMPGAGAEQYHSINVRHDGLWSGGGTGNNPLNGYRLMVFDDFYEVSRYAAGVKTTLATPAKTWDVNPWFVRWQLEGTAIRARIWQGAEPGTWEVDTTDATHATGILSMVSLNGTTSTARPIRWDNLLVNDFAVGQKFIMGRPA